MSGDEKRLSKRMDLSYRLGLTIIKSENGRDLPPFEVEITDVSSGGLGFICDEQLMIGEIFHGTLRIWTKQKMNIILKIVRSSVEEEGYSYGSIFVGMQNNDTLGIKIYEMLNDK